MLMFCNLRKLSRANEVKSRYKSIKSVQIINNKLKIHSDRRSFMTVLVY